MRARSHAREGEDDHEAKEQRPSSHHDIASDHAAQRSIVPVLRRMAAYSYYRRDGIDVLPQHKGTATLEMENTIAASMAPVSVPVKRSPTPACVEQQGVHELAGGRNPRSTEE